MKKSLFIFIIFFSVYSLAQTDPDSIRFRSPKYTDNSVLGDGKVYKIEVSKDGIYKIPYSYLNDMGLNLESINPKNIKLYGNGGGMLPQLITDNYMDDLVEVPIYIEGEADEKFDQSDYILFYGEGQDKWIFNNTTKNWNHIKNIYSDHNYYYLKISDTRGLRIDPVTNQNSPFYISNNIDSYAEHEEDLVNLLGSYNKTEGSGQDWYGEFISNGSEKDFSSYFKNFIFDKSEGVDINVVFAGRDDNSKSLTLSTSSATFDSTINGVSISDPESIYANTKTIRENFIPAKDKVSIKIKYQGEKGWLDKIILNSRMPAKFQGKQMMISDKYAPNNTIAGITLKGTNTNTMVWDITDHNNVKSLDIAKDNNTIVYNSGKSSRFIAFDKTGDFLTPGKSTEIENQNIHGILDAEMLVVYPQEFEESAIDFAKFREEHSGIKTYAVELQKIFNEFSCGKWDPTAIRDFARMLKVKNDKFNYLLLFGDGSFDARGRMRKTDNFIPVYETKKSLDPIFSFPSDDYFGLLSYGEGTNRLSGKVDIAIGRFPVRNIEQAKIFVQKIKDYETDINHYGNWINNISLSADDIDTNGDTAHFFGAERINTNISKKYPVFNINKIYLDSYIQENNAGGQRYPDATRAINLSFYSGNLMFVYVGHGGPKGLAQERVLQINDILNWENKYKLPLLITATCSFTGFDDPKYNTAGEIAFLKKKGGVIGLFSTVRAVYSSSNDALMESTFDAFFKDDESKHLPIGEIIKISKNTTSSSVENKRKFLLFGDPSLRMKFPKYKVVTQSINDIPVDSTAIIDTLSALDKVTIKGYIADNSGQIMNDFNGKINVTLFDKPVQRMTNNNDHQASKYKFTIQRDILFKGLAKVNNGEFEIAFILPKDINYQYGRGKLSYYAIDNKLEQAAGYYTGFSIGGTSGNVVIDKEGPEIDLYMNDIGFAYGGITNSSPILLGYLSDESGINISSSSIGHELSGEMDKNIDDKFILNDFYKSDVNSYKKGSFRYPLSKLKPGKHTIKVTAYDIFNNKSEKLIEFVVLDKSKTKLSHVLNYPNPFTTQTNFRFEHDLADSDLDIIINIFTLSGKVVKTIKYSTFSPGFEISDISWDGTDDYGSKLANGIYLYKIKVFSQEYNITKESKFEKLVILK